MIERISREDWEHYDREHPAPTFFARPAWAYSLADAYPALEPSPLRIGKNPRVLVPAMVTKNRVGFSEVIAFPLGTYTALLDENGNPVTPTIAMRTLRTLRQHFGRVRLVVWPLGPQPVSNRGNDGAVHTTSALDCSNGFDAALSSMRGVTRRMAGQAARHGVSCRKAKETELLAYYQMLRDAAPDGSRRLLPYALLEAVLRRGGDDAQLWFAERDGRKLAGGIVLFGSQELFFWSAALRREDARLRPSNALNIALVRAACDRGMRWYNMGASEGLAGVEQFKHGFGTKDSAYAEIAMRQPLYALYEQIRSRITWSWTS